MLGLILRALFAQRKLAFIEGISSTIKTVRMIRQVIDPHYGIRLYTARLFAGFTRNEALHNIFLRRYSRENGLYFKARSYVRKSLRNGINMQKRLTRMRLKERDRRMKKLAKEYAKLQRQIARLQTRIWAKNRREVGKIFRQKQRQEKKIQFERGRQWHEDRNYVMGYRHLSHFRNWTTPEEAQKMAIARGDKRGKQRPVIALPFFSTGLHEGIYYRDTHSARLFMKQRGYPFKKFQWQIFKHMADAGTQYQLSYLNGWRGAGTVYGREYKGVFNFHAPFTEEQRGKQLNFLGRGGTVKNTGETRFVKNFNKGLIHTKKEHGYIRTAGVDSFAYLPGRKYKYKFTNKREVAKQQRAASKKMKQAAKQYQQMIQKRYNVHGGNYEHNRFRLLF